MTCEQCTRLIYDQNMGIYRQCRNLAACQLGCTQYCYLHSAAWERDSYCVDTVAQIPTVDLVKLETNVLTHDDFKSIREYMMANLLLNM